MQTVPDIEAVMEALKQQLIDVLVNTNVVDPPVKTVTRQWVPWAQLSELAQPAIILVEPSETEKHRRGQQSAIELNVRLILYMQGTSEINPTSVSISRLNNFIQGVRTALLPSGSGIGLNVQNLGGLVSDCAVVGKIVKDAGVLDSQMSALVPVVINIP